MSKKSPVDSDNYYAYPAWFEDGNQSQPSTSSHSYPTLEYIWSNAVRLTRTTHSNLQDEIEYIEANLGGGNESCNCSELEYKIDRNSTKIYYNSVNITSNANKIENLSDIKLSRDGSQPMTGLLQCEEGLKTNTISTISGDTLTCDKYLKVYSRLWSDTPLIVGCGSPSDEYSQIKFDYGDFSLLTPDDIGVPIERIFIYGGADHSLILVKNADVYPGTDNKWDLGSNSYRWGAIYAVKGNFSGIIVPDAILTNSANISDLDERVDYLEENLSACNCSALQFGIDSNTTKIENLSTIKLSRDGSQSMTGLLKCESGLETNTISSYSGDIIECTDNLKVNGDVVGDSTDGLTLKAEDISATASIKLTPGSAGQIIMGTGTPQSSIVPRIEIPPGAGNVDITVDYANLLPYIDNDQNIGSSDKRWQHIYATKGYFSYIEMQSRIWSNSTLKIGNGTISGDRTRIIFTPSDITLWTSDSGGTLTDRITLTSNADRSIVYIKNAHLLPYDNLSSYLGSTAHRWIEVFADRGSFAEVEGKDNLKLAGGDPSVGHAQIELHNGSAAPSPGALIFLTTNESGNPIERLKITGEWNIATLYVNKAHLEPYYDNSYRLGSSVYRWSDIYAVNTHWGDLGFIETTCPKCDKKFRIGDNIILKLIRFSEEDGSIMTIPIHLECAKLPTKTIRKKYPVKEKYYEWDERLGRIVAKWRIKKEKKKIKKKRLKSGYKINQKTGRIEAVNRKNIDLSEAIEEVEEEIEEIVYKEREIKI